MGDQIGGRQHGPPLADRAVRRQCVLVFMEARDVAEVDHLSTLVVGGLIGRARDPKRSNLKCGRRNGEAATPDELLHGVLMQSACRATSRADRGDPHGYDIAWRLRLRCYSL